jgi:sporulation protein YlmC with PRC-barrel domain
MLLTIENMLDRAVMSLQTGQPLAKLDSAIVNPKNLKIVAFYVSGPLVDHAPAVLFSDDIREFGDMGAIVDSSDNIMSPEGMVRLNEVIDYGFQLPGIAVVDTNGRKMGKVENYTLNPENFEIQQLYIKPNLMKSLSISHLTVARSQITEVSSDKIIVKVPTVRDKVAEKVTEVTENTIPFDNPFRKPKPVSENIDQE